MSDAASQRPWTRRLRWLIVALLAVVVAVVSLPLIVLERRLGEVRTCIASYEAVRSAELPDCSVGEAGLRQLKTLPWTRQAARRSVEELRYRHALAGYLDAAVGEPDRAALQVRFSPLIPLQHELLMGTGRQRFDELGEPLAALELGAWAQRAGDRVTLIEQGARWGAHYVASHALEAALLNGDSPRAVALASDYLDHPSGDMRQRVAALLCIGGEPKRGIAQILELEQERATKRHANYWRDFGGLRVTMEVCSQLAGSDAPTIPEYGYAGRWDQRARIMAWRLRLLWRQCTDRGDLEDCPNAATVKENSKHVVELLSSGQAQPQRALLVAAIAHSLDDAAAALKLAEPRAGEPSWQAQAPWLPEQWIDSGRDAGAYLPPDMLVAAAAHLRELGRSGRRSALKRFAALLELHAAAGFAAQGRAADVREAAKRGARLARDPRDGMVWRASMALLLGDRAQAGRLLAAVRGDGEVAAAAALLKARAHLPDRVKAHTAAGRALELAGAADSTDLSLRSRWLQAATAPLLAAPVDVVQGSATPAAPRPIVLGRPGSYADAALRLRALDDFIGQWQRWIGGNPSQRRAARYAAFHERPNMPASHSGYWLLAGQLVDRPEQVEVWLDALSSQQSRVLGLRQQAWGRAEAARGRGDEAAEKIWRERYRSLARFAVDEKLAELYRLLGV